jgi:AcrR family transcriptional regulator
MSTANPSPPLPRRGNSSGDAARQRAMEAAIEAIAELGADNVRMADIAARAGMSTGHILYHFGRKDRLLVEVLRWSEQDLTCRVTAALGRMRSPVRKLEYFVTAYLPGADDTQRWALWTQLVARPPQDIETRHLLDTFVEAWEGMLGDIVVEGKEKEEFRELDVAEFVLRSRAMLDGLALEIISGSLRLDVAAAHRFAVRAMATELAADGK